MEAKGKTLIRITSVLFLITGFISTIAFLIPTLLAGAFTGSTTGNTQLGGMVITGLFMIYLILSIFEFIVGIIGLKDANKPEKSGKLIILGVIILIISIVNGVRAIAGQDFGVQTALSVMCGIILPILFIYGAKKNQKS